MSVDFVGPSISLPEQGPVRDLFVIIGGWAKEDWASSDDPPMPATPAYSSTGDLVRRVQGSELNLAAGHVKEVFGIKGRFKDTDVDAAFDLVKKRFDPRGKLIVHGHSIGGAAVHTLCRRIDAEGVYYDLKYGGFTVAPFSTGVTYESRRPLFRSAPGGYDSTPPSAPPRPPGMPFPLNDPNAPANPRVRVDLLVTVDAAVGNLSKMMDRSVGKCVRTNLNYYQTTRKNIEQSCGGPNTAVDPKMTMVWNHDLTNKMLPDPDMSKPPLKPDHFSIQAQCNNLIMKIFQQALDIPQVTDFWDAA
jgi:hypothetical protein